MLFHDRELFSGRKAAFDSSVALLAFVYSAWAIYGAGHETIAKGFMLLLLGIPVYLYLKWREHTGAPLTVPEHFTTGDGPRPRAELPTS
jgi:APA family basic amino acid/polyamine antiporter